MTENKIAALKRHKRWERLAAGLADRCGARHPDERDKTYTERLRAPLLKAGYGSSTISNWAKPDRGVPDKEIGNLATLMGWALEYMDDGRLPKEALPEQDRENRDLSTPEDVGMPEKEGHTTTVKQPPESVKADPIIQLPLLSWGMIDRIGMPNNEVQGMVLVNVTPGPWDPERDKVVVMPDTSFGQRPAMGDMLIFRPLRDGEELAPTSKPILVVAQDGRHMVMAYNALTMTLNKLRPVAVCRHWHPPIDD